MLFDPVEFTIHRPLAPGSALRRWLTRLCLAVCLAVGAGAALLLFAPLL
ncbi:MAG: hypothetical protein Kow00114_29930 [Kiloniellaceae bacterium]